MSSFTGMSVLVDGSLSTMSAVDPGTNSGYHLLMVQGYSRTNKEVPTGESISSGRFMVGGHRWYLNYYPNGEIPECADFISIYLCLDEDVELPVDALFLFSFVDQVEKQNPLHIRTTKTYSFSNNASSFPCWGFDRFIRREALERSTDLKGDCFTIRCDVIVCKDNPNTHDNADIGQHLNNLLANKVGADVTFVVKGEMIVAHRCVLAARSSVFMAQLFGCMKEGTKSTVIHINDMELKVFKALLSFIYTGICFFEEEDRTLVKEEEDVEYVMWLQDMLVGADIYDLQQLKHVCEHQLSEHIGVSSVASTLALAEQHFCERLKEACFKFIRVQSPSCLEKVMASGGWEHVTTTYPSLMDEITVKLGSKT